MKRLNIKIFKLLKILLGLTLKGAEANIAYTYDEADAIHEQIMKYFTILSILLCNHIKI